MIEFDRYITLLEEKKINANQFLVCWLVHFRMVAEAKRLVKHNLLASREEIQDLIERGFLLQTKRDSTSLTTLVTTALYTEDLFIDSEDAFEDILKVYPHYFIINGAKVSTRSCDLYELEEIYYKKIVRGSKKKHEEIIKKTKVIAEKMRTGNINWMKLDKYIKGRIWESEEGDDNQGYDKMV